MLFCESYPECIYFEKNIIKIDTLHSITPHLQGMQAEWTAIPELCNSQGDCNGTRYFIYS